MTVTKRNEEFVYGAVLLGRVSIDADGAIWRTRSGRRIRAERLTPFGYLAVRAMIDGERRWAQAHRLVYLHHVGPIPGDLTINHLNGIRTDNRPENLEPATSQEQIRHSMDVLGTAGCLHQNGEANHAAKLTAVQVVEIRGHRSEGRTYRAIGDLYGVDASCIYKICSGQRWTEAVG